MKTFDIGFLAERDRPPNKKGRSCSQGLRIFQSLEGHQGTDAQTVTATVFCSASRSARHRLPFHGPGFGADRGPSTRHAEQRGEEAQLEKALQRNELRALLAMEAQIDPAPWRQQSQRNGAEWGWASLSVVCTLNLLYSSCTVYLVADDKSCSTALKVAKGPLDLDWPGIRWSETEISSSYSAAG